MWSELLESRTVREKKKKKKRKEGENKGKRKGVGGNKFKGKI